MGKKLERHFGFQNATRPIIKNNHCLLFLLQVPNESELNKTTYFVPIAEPEQPFVRWEVRSSGPSKGSTSLLMRMDVYRLKHLILHNVARALLL